MKRRTFIRASGAAVAGAAVGGVALGPLVARSYAGETPPSERLPVAVIGVAGRGKANLHGVADTGAAEIVAVCDVDARNLEAAAKAFPKARPFADFRRMLDEVGQSVAAVVVSTPDHTHAPAAARALRMDKHVYCEKPLAHSVREVRTLTDLARQRKRMTQLGTQIHAEDNYRRVVELVRGGAVGPVREVHVWSSARYGGVSRPAETPPVPEHLSWDLWLGPAPARPYHPCYVPGSWRSWRDFGTGALGDFGCHYMDLPFWALGLAHPLTVEAEGPPLNAEAVAAWLIVRYAFPARGDLPPVALTWYDSGRRPEQLLAREDLVKPETRGKANDPLKWGSGVLFVGEKGMLLADYGRHMLLPEAQFAEFAPPAPTIPKSVGHHREWVQACMTGGQTTCGFDYSGPLTETVLLGVVSHAAGQKLAWDAAALKAANCPKADALVSLPYRDGWTL